MMQLAMSLGLTKVALLFTFGHHHHLGHHHHHLHHLSVHLSHHHHHHNRLSHNLSHHPHQQPVEQLEPEMFKECGRRGSVLSNKLVTR